MQHAFFLNSQSDSLRKVDSRWSDSINNSQSVFIWVSIHQPTERIYVRKHVCMFDRTRRERGGQSHGGTVRSRPRLSSPDCLDWLKKTNPSGQAVGWRQALPGPPPLLLLYTKLFQMIYCCSPFWDWLLLTFHSPEQRLTGDLHWVHCDPLLTTIHHMSQWWCKLDLLYLLHSCFTFQQISVDQFFRYDDFLPVRRAVSVWNRAMEQKFSLALQFVEPNTNGCFCNHWGHVLLFLILTQTLGS